MGTGKTKTKPAESVRAPMPVTERLAIRWTTWPIDYGLTTSLDASSSIGRDKENKTRLDGSEVSRWHARVVVRGGVPYLSDEFERPDGTKTTTNGSFVNGRRIGGDAALGLGDIVRLGQWTGVVCLVPEPDPGFPELAPGLVGGPLLAKTLERARRVAESDVSVALVGETGTGKERVARAIHAWSKRSGKFVPVNCATLEPSLADSELFGHVANAFTGAREKAGLFRTADGGTLFLDEVIELPAAVQSKLLRTLEDGEVRPVGSSTPVKVSVRVISATQHPLMRAVESGRFRMDLLQRLEHVAVEVPALRNRREDVPHVFDWLVAHETRGKPPQVEPRLLEVLCLYDWPGNVRELVNVTKELLALKETLLQRKHLPQKFDPVGSTTQPPPSDPEPVEGTRNDRELAALKVALKAHLGNVERAAESIGLKRGRAYRLMDAANIDPNDYRDVTRR